MLVLFCKTLICSFSADSIDGRVSYTYLGCRSLESYSLKRKNAEIHRKVKGRCREKRHILLIYFFFYIATAVLT